MTSSTKPWLVVQNGNKSSACELIDWFMPSLIIFFEIVNAILIQQYKNYPFIFIPVKEMTSRFQEHIIKLECATD